MASIQIHERPIGRELGIPDSGNTCYTSYGKEFTGRNSRRPTAGNLLQMTIVFHYSRLLGLGGYPNPSPYPVESYFQELVSVTAVDKYTVEFKWKTANSEFIMEALHGVMQRQCIENPEAVQVWGNLSDWRHAIGTGPFFLKNFTTNKEAVLVKDPNYWGHDERYPQNKIPYLDSIKYQVITDDDTALEAMRAGKIDIMDRVSYEQAERIRKTNPEIQTIRNPTTRRLRSSPEMIKPLSTISELGKLCRWR